MLYILTPLFCAGLCLGTVFSFLKTDNKVTANAAVTPPTANTITFEQLGTYAYAQRQNTLPGGVPIPYGTATALSTSGVSASVSGKTITATKEKSENYIISYVAFKSVIEVPAMTEYVIDYKAALKLIKYRNGGSSANVWCQLLYFGNDYDNPSATDESSTISFSDNTGVISSYDIGDQLVANKYTSSGSTASSGETITMTGNAEVPTLTYTNNTSGKKTYTAYFGFVGQARCADAFSTANGIEATADFSKSTIKVNTEIQNTPSVDVNSIQYDGQNHDFTFTYDNLRLNVTKWDFTDRKGNITPTTGNPLDATGKMQATAAGTYKLYFDIKDECGAVWDLTTKDQTTKTVSFTITPISLNAPSGTVEADYSGAALTVNNAKTVPGWYNNLIYTDSTILTLSPATVTNANESGYTVTATIVSEGHVWSDVTSNPSDARSFIFKVNKKPLDIEFEDKDGVQVAKLKDATQISSSDKDGAGNPTFTLKTKYYKAGSSPNSAVDVPNGLGDWVAMAVIEGTGAANYKVDATKSFNTSKKQIAYPVLNSDQKLGYNGNSQEFVFTGFDSATMNCTEPSGADSFDGSTLKATNAGTYTPTYTLKDTELYEWSGTAPSAVEITPKSVTILPDQNNKTEWEKGEAVNLTFTAYALSGESLQLAATSQRDGFAATDIAVTNNGDGTHTVTIPANTVRGSYTLTVKVAESSSNYVAASEITHAFTITAAGAALEESEIVWVIGGKNYTVDNLNDDGVLEIEYTGDSVTPTVDGKSLVLAGVKVDEYGKDTSAKEVDDYEITVHIIADSDEVAFDKTFTLKYKIVPKKLDFSNAEWEYSSDNGATWTKLTASNKPSYTGDPITVRISPEYMKGLGLDFEKGDYTETYTALSDPTEQGEKTTNVELTINNSNYTTADESGYVAMPYNWEITAKALTYNWNGTQAVEVGDNAFEFPAVVFDDGNDYSQYYEYVYTVNGKDYTLEELKEYIAENWSETTPVSGTISVRMKDGVTEVNIKSGSRAFTTGAPKTALTVEVTGSGAEYGLVDFALSVVRGTADERARVEVKVAGGTLTEAKTFDGNSPELVEFVNGLDVGKYTITVSLKASSEASYVLTKSIFDFEVLIRKIIVPQVTKDIVYNGDYINLVDYLDSNYNANVMSMLSGYTNKNAGAYAVTFKLKNSNYMWVEPASAEPMNKLLAKALFKNEISINNSELTATLDWSIGKIVLSTDGWNLKSKEGASLNALADYQNMITANGLDVAIGYRYYDTNGNLLEEPVLKGGEKYIVEAYLTGADAINFEFADGTDDIKSISARQDYTVPQSAVAAFFGSALNFAKANLLWLIIAAVALIFLIILICIIVSAKKKKRRREELAEQRRLEKEEREREEREERKREQEERRREEREERMARMSQMQAPQPQYIPQPMPQPQYMPQSMPQNSQSAPMGGGSMDGSQFALIQAELAAIKAEQSAAKELAAMRAEQSAAKELAELKAQQAAKEAAERQVAQSRLETQVANLESRIGGEVSNINVDAMTEIMTRALKNVLASATQQAVVTAPPAQPAQITDGSAAAPAATQVPPDAVMTTVTTTKIDTTKKQAQPAQAAQTSDRAAPAGRTIVRNFVAPMPVDDGRVFDVGGFYTPADPIVDMGFGDDEKKD